MIFKKKRKLYENKKYLMLFLSIISDVAVTTIFSFFVVMMIWCRLDPGVDAGIGYYWVVGMGLNMLIGIPSKMLDIFCIRYKKDTDELKKHSLLFLHCVLSIPTILYWGTAIVWMIGGIFHP